MDQGLMRPDIPNTLKPDPSFIPVLRPGVFPHPKWWDAVQKMANRMAVSQEKYGDIEGVLIAKTQIVASLRERLDLYEQTGNTEWLLDVGNLAIIEHVCPQHPNAHFRATDSDESPGMIGRPETRREGQ